MHLKDLRKYFGIFIMVVLLIAVYKTFDNLNYFFGWIRKILSLLTPVFIGFFIAYILFTPCKKLENLCIKTNMDFFIKYRRGISVATIYLLFIIIVALVLLAVIPALTKSISDFMEQLPSLLYGAVTWFNSLGIYELNYSSVQGLLNNNIFSIEKILNSFNFDTVNKYAKSVMSIGTTFFNGFMGIIISVYILLDRKDLKTICRRISSLYVPKKTSDIIVKYLNKVHQFINLYISCQLLDALILFVLSFISLAIMKVEYTPLLALLVGSFNLIPYFGAITATIIAALITLVTKGFYSALAVLIILIILQQIDANFLQPKIVSGSLNVKPFWVIVGILLGGGLFGIIGIFLAVPIIALIRIIVLDILDVKEKQKDKITE